MEQTSLFDNGDTIDLFREGQPIPKDMARINLSHVAKADGINLPDQFIVKDETGVFKEIVDALVAVREIYGGYDNPELELVLSEKYTWQFEPVYILRKMERGTGDEISSDKPFCIASH